MNGKPEMTNIQSVINETSQTILECGAAAAIGYLCARVFTSINPAHAAVVSAVSILVSKIVDPVFQRVFAGPGANDASKFLGTVLNITLSVSASAAIASAMGFPISATAFFWLNIVGILAVPVVTIAVVVAAAAGLALKEALKS